MIEASLLGSFSLFNISKNLCARVCPFKFVAFLIKNKIKNPLNFGIRRCVCASNSRWIDAVAKH